jgi:heme/copper-type cytochrome/quinol oxidase subunit 2
MIIILIMMIMMIMVIMIMIMIIIVIVVIIITIASGRLPGHQQLQRPRRHDGTSRCVTGGTVISTSVDPA